MQNVGCKAKLNVRKMDILLSFIIDIFKLKLWKSQLQNILFQQELLVQLEFNLDF